MKKVILSIIAAIGSNRELGINNKLLWQIPEDMKRFRELTTGHAIIMGQKTFESIGKPLFNRMNIVLTHDTERFTKVYKDIFHNIDKQNKTKTVVVASIDEALQKAQSLIPNEVFIIGGGMIYKQFLPLVHRLYLTLVDGEFEADVYFPEYEKEFPRKVFEQRKNDGKYRFTFVVLERASP